MQFRHDLDAAYRATTYTADTPEGEIAIRIDESNARLDRLLVARSVTSWAYVTAYNPASIPTVTSENEARQRKLRTEVAGSGHVFFEGEGIGDSWPAELSLLILGITDEDAVALGRRFGQLAIVVGELGKLPKLLWLQPDGADGDPPLRL
jgi:hypothetical protein